MESNPQDSPQDHLVTSGKSQVRDSGTAAVFLQVNSPSVNDLGVKGQRFWFPRTWSMWQSQIEIECYVLLCTSSAPPSLRCCVGELLLRTIRVLYIDAYWWTMKCIWALPLVELQRFRLGDMLEIGNWVTFCSYPGLPHMCWHLSMFLPAHAHTHTHSHTPQRTLLLMQNLNMTLWMTQRSVQLIRVVSCHGDWAGELTQDTK